MSDPDARLRALEAAVARLEARADAAEAQRANPGSPAGDETPPPGDERLWFLRELQRRHPEGAVAFAGHADLPIGVAEWQWGRLTGEVLEEDWDEAAAPLAALGHPVRLHLLRLILSGTTTTAELSETEGLGTTGQLHHHLRALVSAGWLVSSGRGRYTVPAHRVIPLLVLVSATV